jgi:hypothetical protein
MDKDILKSIRDTTIAQSGADYLKDQELMMKTSILLEATRKEAREKQLLYAGAVSENRELKQQVGDLKALVSELTNYINDSLETFEAMFESDEDSFDYDRMAQYVLVAGFMRAWKGRPCIVERVNERMRKLPF